MAKLEEVFVIKSVVKNKYYIENWDFGKSWSSEISDASTYNSYSDASTQLSSDSRIKEGMYQIEKIFKKPVMDYDGEE